MKNFLYNTSLLGMIFITACTSNTKTKSKSDTIEVFKAILSSKDFTPEITGNDTIHFLENKFIGDRWPSKISNVTIKYIPDTGTARSKNGRWIQNEIIDQRLRYEIKTFDVTADSAYVMIYHYNFVNDCHYKLKKRGKTWLITLASCGSE